MKLLPKARNSEIIVREFDRERLIYDLTTHRAYQLNETLMIIHQACDGKTNFSELKRKHKFTDDLIDFALDELQANNLLEGERTNHFSGFSRREIIKRVGLASMVALPMITGIIVPSAVNAASNCAAQNRNCTFNNFQQSNCCTSGFRCTYEGISNNTTCQACSGPGDNYAGDPSNSLTVASCNAKPEKNVCCVTRGNSGTNGSYCTCPITL